MRAAVPPAGIALARLLMASVFVVMGGYRIWLAARGIPTPGSVLTFSTAEVVLGLWLAAGWRLGLAAGLAAALMLADAALAHPFWTHTGAARDGQLLHFMKNIGFSGGLLLLALTAPAHRKR